VNVTRAKQWRRSVAKLVEAGFVQADASQERGACSSCSVTVSGRRVWWSPRGERVPLCRWCATRWAVVGRRPVAPEVRQDPEVDLYRYWAFVWLRDGRERPWIEARLVGMYPGASLAAIAAGVRCAIEDRALRELWSEGRPADGSAAFQWRPERPRKRKAK
jgi:hypothetical protein